MVRFRNILCAVLYLTSSTSTFGNGPVDAFTVVPSSQTFRTGYASKKTQRIVAQSSTTSTHTQLLTRINNQHRILNAFTTSITEVYTHALRMSTSSSSSSVSANDYSKNIDLIPAINLIMKQNDLLYDKLSEVRDNASFFRYFSVDILGSCEYMSQELFECYTEKCEIYPEDDDEIPEKISNLDKKEGTDLFVLDGWSRWDMPSNDYYDTQAFPEGYTGYDGSEVWNFIHERICFSEYPYDADHWKADFNKAVSGLHSMISAQIIRGIRDKIDNDELFGEDEIWKNPTNEYQRRLSSQGETPLAMENLFFAFMLLLSAVEKAKPRYLAQCESGLIDSDAVADLKFILNMPLFKDPSIQIAASKLQKDASNGGTNNSELWQARMRCRDLLRIMNCVQCNKCRFHGKISVMGLITALHVVLGQDGTGCDVQTLNRVEMATLLTTLHKFSAAIHVSQDMQQELGKME